MNSQSPLGLTWDENDYSCAYDSLFTVLRHIWFEGQLKQKAYFENGPKYFRILHSQFTSLFNETCTFEAVRDNLRFMLNREKPSQYLYGRNYTDIDELVRDFTSAKLYGMSHLQCLSCKFSFNRQHPYLTDYTAVGWSSLDQAILEDTASVQTYLDYKLIKKNEKTTYICPKCLKNRIENQLYSTQCINELPMFLIFALSSWIDIDRCIEFEVLNSRKKYTLKGIIYSNRDHFTARLIDENLDVWYHDGQTTRSLCQREQSLMHIDGIVPLKTFGQYNAIMAFYVEK